MNNFWVLILLDCNPWKDSFLKVNDDTNVFFYLFSILF